MISEKLFLTLLTFATAGVACGTSLQYFAAERPSRPLSQRSAESVAVFKDNAPDRPFRTIGYIEGQQDAWSLDSVSGVIKKMQRRAAEIGCDGLMLLSSHDRQQDHTTTLRGFRGGCIVFETQAPRP